MTRVSLGLYINHLVARSSLVSCINLLGLDYLNLLLARVSLVSCINLFGANQLDAFSVQFGANQIINWCAPINYLDYLVRAKLFSPGLWGVLWDFPEYTLGYSLGIFHNKLSYPRARSAIPCFIEHRLQLF